MGEKATEEEEELQMRGKKGSAKGDEVAPGGGDPAGIAVSDPGMPPENREGTTGAAGEPEPTEGATFLGPWEKGGEGASGDPLKDLNVSKGGGKSKS